ncbi:SDR family oxidoreductase [Psychrobacter sp. FDAARGOS_221]|uniref:SDR family oxidoreductase n=1 Tax=Psychrobacter sp. FDAARGOS_221 TaxID=1975705 RepID=UPI000BB56FB1|nr:SDR family oxidoreductase [Psychrobacter sp. FDAARGOS_221]PNK60678.1 SDR family NAD(P)-dependent oxidoreductase [Psychrobacter sp. FDAARGOS_221]
MAQTYIVTGAASGIGHALCQRLLADNHQVCACDINTEALQASFGDHKSVTDGGNLLLQTLDVRRVEAWQAVVSEVIEHWGRVDVLCNIAGVLKENWVADIVVPDEVDLHFDINVKGTIFGTQNVIEVMRKQGAGHIINVASLAALSPVPGLSLYSASKFAVRSYSLAAGMELGQYGIAVTTVCPDAVQTPMLDQQKDKEQAALTFSGNRTLSVDEVVDAIVGPIISKRPLEVVLPASRGVVAKVANMFPQTTGNYVDFFRKQGAKRQAKS